MLGRAQCEVLSCVDLKEAFHSVSLTPEAKEFCGILPYLGTLTLDMRYSLWDRLY